MGSERFRRSLVPETMPARTKGHTTLPSNASTFGGEAPESSLLAWLFPRTDGPVLDLDPREGREAVIGRDDGNAVVLPGDDVSRQHAAIARGPVIVLNDLKSRNGTFVNGKRVTTVAARSGDVVRIGGWVGVVTAQVGPFGSLAPGLYCGGVLRKALVPAERAASAA